MIIGNAGAINITRNAQMTANTGIVYPAQSIRPNYNQQPVVTITPAVSMAPTMAATNKRSNNTNNNSKTNNSGGIVNVVPTTLSAESSKQPKTLDDLLLKPLEITWSIDYDIEKIHDIIMSYLKTKKARKEILMKGLHSFKFYDNQSIPAEEIAAVRTRIDKLNDELTALEKISMLDYSTQCSPLIREYKQLCISAPRVFGQEISVDSMQTSKKLKVVELYFERAKLFYPMNIHRNIKSSGLCPHCNSLITDTGDQYICSGCNSIQSKVETGPEYTKTEDFTGKHNNTVDKNNINYHDTILQIQAKFPINIPQKVYDSILTVISTYKNFDIAKLSKWDLYKIMKEQGLSFWYKHLNKIHTEITKVAPTDLSAYEYNLYRRGELLSEIYNDIKDPDRSNFMNGLYLVWLFLMNEEAPIDMSDFLLIKGRGSELSNISTLEKGFEILKKTHPEYTWRIYQLP